MKTGFTVAETEQFCDTRIILFSEQCLSISALPAKKGTPYC
ncbi:hypothetical protein ACPAVH_35525 [Enterobacteriaceae bacterium TYF_5]